MATASHAEEHHLHVSSIGFNAIILVALLVLTGLTYWTATLDLGLLDTPVALMIAFGKTSLVILYFMHVRWGSGYVKVLAITGFAFLLFLFGFTVADVATRTQEHPWSEYTWVGAAHRTGLLEDAPSESTDVEGVVPQVGDGAADAEHGAAERGDAHHEREPGAHGGEAEPGAHGGEAAGDASGAPREAPGH